MKISSHKEMNITFCDQCIDDDQCIYRNKYGEYVCNNARTPSSKYCVEHETNIRIFDKKKEKLLKMMFKTQNSKNVKKYANIMNNFTNFIIVYKDYIVCYNISSIVNAIIYNANNMLRYIGIRYKFNYTKKYSKEYVENLMCDIISRITPLYSHYQIKTNRILLKSNVIKIEKLLSINVKVLDKSNAVIVDGIDRKILSYIV